jgi:4-diphosphocytidyl-2-C-methyl-D-erythritol kinase
VLVNPRVHVSAQAAYQARTGAFTSAIPLPSNFTSLATLFAFLREQRNDLQPAALSLAPVIANVLAALFATNAALVRMSGSGSTCFGLYETLHDANIAAEKIALSQPHWWVVPTILRGTHGKEK